MLVRGTRIVAGVDAIRRRWLLDRCMDLATSAGFSEVVLPSLEFAALYADKAGPEVLEQMYTFPDRKGRQLCLRPEGTATCQDLARTDWQHRRDLRVWYDTRCWRYERPQAGRYREFTQFGVEVLNPTHDHRDSLIQLATTMVAAVTTEFVVDVQAQRGLAYYTGAGFEIRCPALGAQQQVVGGGSYAEAIGFAVGLDRLALLITGRE